MKHMTNCMFIISRRSSALTNSIAHFLRHNQLLCLKGKFPSSSTLSNSSSSLSPTLSTYAIPAGSIESSPTPYDRFSDWSSCRSPRAIRLLGHQQVHIQEQHVHPRHDGISSPLSIGIFCSAQTQASTLKCLQDQRSTSPTSQLSSCQND